MKPIKVVFVNGGPLLKGGIETFMMNYFKNIDRSKIQIEFIVHGFEKGVYDEEILSHGGKIYTVPLLKDHPFTYFKKFKEVFNIAKPDIIHSHMNAMNAVVLMIAKKNNIPIKTINKISEGSPHVVDFLESKKINLVINTTEGKTSTGDSYIMRRNTLLTNTPYYITIKGADTAVNSIEMIRKTNLQVMCLQSIH